MKVYKARIRKLPAIVLLACVALQEHLALAAEQPIIIPGIFSRWRLPGDENKAQITIDEIGKCMGSDVKVHELYDFLASEGAALERTAVDVTREAESVKSMQAGLQAAEAKLSESVKNLNARGEALERRRADIEKARKNPKTDAEVKAFNKSVDLFNKEAAEFRSQGRTLDAEMKVHAANVAAYNSAAEMSNGKVAAFNARVVPYKAKSDQFDQLQVEYRQRCTGERRIVK